MTTRTSAFKIVCWIVLAFILPGVASGTELIEDALFSLTAKKEVSLEIPKGRVLIVSDVARLFESAFGIPVSSEEPWRPEYTPLPFEIKSGVQITKGETLANALNHVMDELDGYLTYDISNRVLVIYPKYAEHRILSCSDVPIHTENTDITVWGAMKSIAKQINCSKKAPSLLIVTPKPFGHNQKVPKEFTENVCVHLDTQEVSVRDWFLIILRQSNIPISYDLWVNYRPTRFPKSAPQTTITIRFTGPGLQASGEDESMPRSEMLWWMDELEDLRCEDKL